MTKFICKNCGFKVESEKAGRCPYCDRKTLEKEPNAEELLDSVKE
jgi:DNA-directed RNA polymerase subunit RPC12/RpoP